MAMRRMAALSVLITTLAMSSVVGSLGGQGLQLAVVDTTAMPHSTQ